MFETSDSNETTVKIGKGAINFEKTQANEKILNFWRWAAIWNRSSKRKKLIIAQGQPTRCSKRVIQTKRQSKLARVPFTLKKLKQTKKFKIRGDDRLSEIGLANEKIENCRGSGHRMFETSDSNETTIKFGKGEIHFDFERF